jgi:hypothetical protein
LFGNHASVQPQTWETTWASPCRRRRRRVAYRHVQQRVDQHHQFQALVGAAAAGDVDRRVLEGLGSYADGGVRYVAGVRERREGGFALANGADRRDD